MSAYKVISPDLSTLNSQAHETEACQRRPERRVQSLPRTRPHNYRLIYRQTAPFVGRAILHAF